MEIPRQRSGPWGSRLSFKLALWTWTTCPLRSVHPASFISNKKLKILFLSCLTFSRNFQVRMSPVLPYEGINMLFASTLRRACVKMTHKRDKLDGHKFDKWKISPAVNTIIINEINRDFIDHNFNSLLIIWNRTRFTVEMQTIKM
jgi:hypothetical protein